MIRKNNPPIIALITDFGSTDAYAGILKGVLFSVNPSGLPVDLCHEIPPQNILSAGYVLYTAWDYFPVNTVFVGVIDPGVGTTRHNIVLSLDGKHVVCPDNGLISLLLRMKGRGKVNKIDEDAVHKHMKKPISATFHGRDIYAPAAGLITLGQGDEIKGPPVQPVLCDEFYPKKTGNKISGAVIHTDRFGNCISTIHESEIHRSAVIEDISCQSRLHFKEIKKTYADVEKGKPLCCWGSSGFLEIGIRNGNAAEQLGIQQGDRVIIKEHKNTQKK